jgi:hypothetical protein
MDAPDDPGQDEVGAFRREHRRLPRSLGRDVGLLVGLCGGDGRGIRMDPVRKRAPIRARDQTPHPTTVYGPRSRCRIAE